MKALPQVSVLLLWAAVTAANGYAQIHPLVVDFTKTNGLIRPLHGVNSGPLCYRGTVDLTEYHRALKIPLTRLHDVMWVNAEAVDMHVIFRDFRDDPEQPENYDFRSTDDYIQAIFNAGSQVLFRLGESIEHTPNKYRVNPPADPEKWAAACLGIIRHYNEGWADGFRHNIQYWEIWNEPDIRPQMWTGTEEQFLQLFEVTAKKIKARYPKLKVGGPALGNTGEMQGDTLKPSKFMTNFLAFCRQRQVPLDFFSWHTYGNKPWEMAARAREVRRILDAHGYRQAESHLNEWNYLPGGQWLSATKEGQGLKREQWAAEMGGPAAAAFNASVLMALQDSPLEMANFFTGEIQSLGLFSFEGVPKKSFYAFKAFRELLETPQRVEAAGAVEGQVAVLAGTSPDHSKAAVLVSNYEFSGDLHLQLRQLPWPGATKAEMLLVDSNHNLDSVQKADLPAGSSTVVLGMKKSSVALIKLFPAPH